MNAESDGLEELSAREVCQGETRGHMRLVLLISTALAIVVGVVLLAAY
ncbi:MAG: hypothetical protein HKN11_16390 [Rhizobiales bacterium]|nr:hypothetical protein [Hyphomicrobiales bacterium]